MEQIYRKSKKGGKIKHQMEELYMYMEWGELSVQFIRVLSAIK